MGNSFVGVDIGGTKLLVATAEESGKLQAYEERPTPKGLAEGLDAIHQMIGLVLDGAKPKAIGAAIGGPINTVTGTASPVHQPTWRDVPLRRIMEEKWGCPFRFDVDTRAAAIAEHHVSESEETPILYITLSTGVGGGLVDYGEVYEGFNEAHPEVGHIFIRSGATCACGADGCLEAYASGRGITKHYGKPPENLNDEEWQQVAKDLGIGLRTLATVYAPQTIILGGGIALAQGDKLLPTATQVMRDGLRLVPVPEVRVTHLGRDTALRGAIYLAMDAADYPAES